MFARSRPSTSPRWPFWLLLAAWVCANCPPIIIHTGLAWVAQARTFTHQQQLTLDVALVLSGEKSSRPLAEAIVRAHEELPEKRLPALPADAAIKKIELSFEKTSELLPLALRAMSYAVTPWVCPEPRPNPPPHGRPRDTNAA